MPGRPKPPVPRSALNGKGAVVRFTLRDVEAMLEMGIIPEEATTELLGGVIVLKDRSGQGDEPTVIGIGHRLSVNKLTNLAGRINTPIQHIQVQNPLVCGDDEVPEPDFAIVRGSVESFPGCLPTGTDATCVVEVADSSLERDVEEKLPTYAAAGVPQYVVLNLRNRTAQVYADPDPAAASYRTSAVLAEDQALSLDLPDGGHLVLPVRDLLP